MSVQRIEQLQQMLSESPDDPFLHYALALEFRSADPQQALAYFEHLLSRHAEYLPTYYHAAALLAELGQSERAKEVYQTGIALARQQSSHHSLRELQNAYQNLLVELDEL
ncbi:tetratricopeptide repeat protein [Cesiribacter andamanensis]|uniref:Putative enzyme of heme biosynthesis n=1 Tax=Cesiribacter andamanensis AMV16 TaxID=1279009 RepID=M7NKX9_9BACT|nr:tetratricopeptide repeat protein [Cesiribacter andamanensis]EMR02450.1 putative enzyme of heme biosynthesis [Cesiribacter andamanensis AMV16]